MTHFWTARVNLDSGNGGNITDGIILNDILIDPTNDTGPIDTWR